MEDMSDKEVEASISLLHMTQPSSEEEAAAPTTTLHDSLLMVVATEAPDGLTSKRRAAHKNKLQRRSAQLTALSHYLTLDELRCHFGKPIVEVAKEFGVCTTFLKKICRRLGVKRWPHRQIRSLTRTVQMLEQVEAMATSPQEKAKYAMQITQLKEKQRLVMENPDANGKLKRVKKYATPAQHTAMDAATWTPSSESDVSNSGVEALAIAAGSFLSTSQLKTAAATRAKQPLAVVIPEAPGVQIPPPSVTTPSHDGASIHASSPRTLKISPSNRKMAVIKSGNAERRVHSSISSLQDQTTEEMLG